MRNWAIQLSFGKRIILGFSAIILLFLSIMITVEVAGIPGTANRGKFAAYRARTLDNMELLSGLLGEWMSSWFLERRVDVHGLAASLSLHQTIESKTSQSSGELAGELQAFLITYPDFKSIAILDPGDASILASRGGFAGARNAKDIGVDPGKWSNVLVPGYAEALDIYVATDKRPRYRIIRQVVSAQNKIMAVLIAECDIDRSLAPFIRSVGNRFSTDWECTVASNLGWVVRQFGEQGDGAQRKSSHKTIASPPIAYALSGIDAPYDGPDQNGRPILAFHRLLKVGGDITLALALTMDRALALKPAWEDIYSQCILWLAMLIAGGGLGIFFARQISRPIKALSAVAHRIESGDLAARAVASDRTEIGQLASVFNSMVDKIETWSRDLEEQVFTRTQELQSISERQDAILTAVPDIIIETDANKVYTWSNSAGIEFFGENLVGKNAASFFVGMHGADEIVQPLFDGAETLRYVESWHRRKDGKARLLAWWCKTFKDEHGYATGELSSARDITESKQIENELRLTKDQAEAANRAKSEFLANMSHEIRTPMNGILGMLQLLQRTSPTPEQKEYLLAAIKSSKRLTRLLTDILDLSRIEAGKLVLDETVFEVKNQKESVLELFAMAARLKGLDLDFFIDERLPPKLIGDKVRLRQILFNLVGNALKFTDKGSVRIEASPLSSSSDSEVRVLFTVADTGIGIPDDRLKDIFEPFVQVENSYVRAHQGAGLGLSIVNKLVKLLGGDLLIDNTDSGGTTVYLSLSFRIPDALQVTDERVMQPPILTSETHLRILFAEDEEVNSMAGKRMLEISGYFVATAKDGQEALKLLTEQDFDLILMDIQMPVMDGVEATKAIRGSSEFIAKSGIPIVAMTAYAMVGDREKFMAAGMNDYISKPVDMEALQEVIERVMGKRKI